MRKVLQQLKQYKRDTFLCIGLTALEVIMEILMPFITAIIIDRGLEAENLPVVYRYGALMVGMAFLALLFGAFAGKNAAGAASGLAANLREAIYANIQTFSFSNIDKFSVPGLVTRMTTDITNVQNAFMMVIRVAVRAPLNRGLPGARHRFYHGGDAEDFQPGVPPVRRPERQRTGECLCYPRGEGLCKRGL